MTSPSSSKFKVGDRVRCMFKLFTDTPGPDYGKLGTVTKVSDNAERYMVRFDGDTYDNGWALLTSFEKVKEKKVADYFAPGDKVRCTDAKGFGAEKLEEGKVYTVRDISVCDGLLLEELYTNQYADFMKRRFVKVEEEASAPEKEDAAPEEKFITYSEYDGSVDEFSTLDEAIEGAKSIARDDPGSEVLFVCKALKRISATERTEIDIVEEDL